MRIPLLAAIASAASLFAAAALAETALPPYAPLAFNDAAGQWVFRSAGIAWTCGRDGRCERLRIDGLPDSDIAAAEIAPLGSAGQAVYLAVRHQSHLEGRPHIYRCLAATCARIDLDSGEFVHLGTFAGRQGDRASGRAAILAKFDADPARSQILWCTETACSEQAVTRENRYDLMLMGADQAPDGLRVWLRDQSGAVLPCAGDPAADRFACERATASYPEFPSDDAEADPSALAASIEAALRRGDLAGAERLLGEGEARFPGQAVWSQLRQRVTQAREARLRLEQARRLVAEARRYAGVGNFQAADALLQEAARLAPNLPELAHARSEVARLRAEREQRFRERGQYIAAIDEAFAAYRLWEAEVLIGEAARRFPNDPAFRAYRARLEEVRAQAEWQRRLGGARRHVAAARQAIERGEFGAAERELDQAERLAPGLPEIRAARAELARERAEAGQRTEELRQLVAAITLAIARKRFDLAERLLGDARRRHPRYGAWSGLQQRIDEGRRAGGRDDRDQAGRLARARQLVAEARRAAAAGRFAEAERDLAEAARLAPDLPELAGARAEVARLKREAEAKDRDAMRRLVAQARDALAKKDLAAAERAVTEAEKLDRDAAEVKAVRAELERAKREAVGDRAKAEQIRKLVADARAAIQRNDLAAAERLVDEAEKLDRDADPVKRVRAELERAKRGRPRR